MLSNGSSHSIRSQIEKITAAFASSIASVVATNVGSLGSSSRGTIAHSARHQIAHSVSTRPQTVFTKLSTHISHQRSENGATDFSSIARSEAAWTAYRSIYLPSMRYSLPATSCTRQKLFTIQSSPIQVLLSATGLNRNMLLAVVVRKASLGGRGLQ